MINKAAEIVTNKFIESIFSEKKLPWQKPWKCVNPRNAVSRKNYQGINVLVLSMFGKDTDFLTYKQAQENGGQVSKGSKGLPVVYFRFLDKQIGGKPVLKANGKPEQFPMMRYSTVFNLSDIEGCEALKQAATNRKKQCDFQPIEICDKLIASANITIKHGGNSAHYSPGIHAISMPEKQTFKSVEAYYCTAFHEIGHSLAKELGEDISNGFGSDPYAKEELVAELFANFCLSYVGIDSADLFDNSAAYFQSWTSRFQKDAGLLISAASKAQKRFNLLLQKAGLLEVKEETEEAEETAVAA